MAIEESLAKANAHIERGGADDLRYAALELRICLEAITYRKLGGMKKYLSEKQLATWQPPQAVKMLLEIDPNADQDFILNGGFEPSLGAPPKHMFRLGEHLTFKSGWLRRHYNKLGSYLHQSNPFALRPAEGISAGYLAEVATDVARVLQSTIHSAWFGASYSFTCKLCESGITVTEARVAGGSPISCFNSNCIAQYLPEKTTDTKVVFKHMATAFECLTCENQIKLDEVRIAIGTEFACKTCKAIHRIETRNWGYARVADLDMQSSENPRLVSE